MTVNGTATDPDARTLTITAELDAPVERVWGLWADPRLLERWWGPPTYPATFGRHELSPDGSVSYFMTGPEGDRHRGWWRILVVEAPRRLEFEDGFADEAGRPDPDMPTTVILMTLEEHGGGGTAMTMRTTFPSSEAMDRVLSMGAQEGMVAAIGQMDSLLQTDAAQR